MSAALAISDENRVGREEYSLASASDWFSGGYFLSSETAANPFTVAPMIFSYSRKQALEDGVLVDLTEWAKETGFCIPVACTATIWNQYIVPPKDTRALGQSERGRGHDLLWMLYNAIRASKRHGEADDRLLYKVIFLQAPHRQETVTLKAICGPGDHGEPVMTVMFPTED